MSWIVDGSNVLGAARLDVESDEAKRALAQRLSGFARKRRTRVLCFFDGPAPDSFASNLGGLTVTFTGAEKADGRIERAAAAAAQCTVVTSDRGLTDRVRRRGVTIVSSTKFLSMIDESEPETPPKSEEWETYFSDPKNRFEF